MPAPGVPKLIRSLFNRGVKPRYIARIVTDLNRKVFRRVFDQVAPPQLRDDACLIVMGSEGRGEQLLRTDQDNGLIFRNEPVNGQREAVSHSVHPDADRPGVSAVPRQRHGLATPSGRSRSPATSRSCAAGWRSRPATPSSSSPFSMTPAASPATPAC